MTKLLNFVCVIDYTMRWIKRLAKDNAELLTKRDTLALFENIILRTCDDNITKACKLVGIERKTYYNWKKDVKMITPECKEKVLFTALNVNMIETLDNLTSKSLNKTCRLLYTTLSTIYGRFLESDSINEKAQLIDKFIETIMKYNKSPVELLHVEINDMIANMKNELPQYDFELKLKRKLVCTSYVIETPHEIYNLTPTSEEKEKEEKIGEIEDNKPQTSKIIPEIGA
jgi:ACT domain-containing protein